MQQRGNAWTQSLLSTQAVVPLQPLKLPVEPPVDTRSGLPDIQALLLKTGFEPQNSCCA